MEQWVEFLSAVPGHLKVFLLGAGSDRQLCENIKEKTSNNNVTILAGHLTMLESAALMKGAVMNYVNDSAPMHLASAMNAPVSAIYCSTVPSFGFGPLSDNSVIIETHEELTCRPCGLHGYRACPEGHFKCALMIQKEQLLASIVRVVPPL
jgi:heptosyltransferase-2